MKKALILLLIAAILTLCVPNVAIATTSKYSAAAHSKIVKDATARQPTIFTLTAPAQVAVNKSYPVYGRLTTTDGKGIAGAKIYLMLYTYGSFWIKVGDVLTTDSGGKFSVEIMQSYKGDYEHEVVYYGDMQYAGSVSNVVTTVAS
jgi:hypothetical protein